MHFLGQRRRADVEWRDVSLEKMTRHGAEIQGTKMLGGDSRCYCWGKCLRAAIGGGRLGDAVSKIDAVKGKIQIRRRNR